MINAEMVLKLAGDLKNSYLDLGDYGLNTFIIAHKTYNVLRWLDHSRKAYPLAPRKLRKIHERSIAKRRQQDRRRWI